MNGKYKLWDNVKYEYNLSDKEKIWGLQLVHVIVKLWVEALNKGLENFMSIVQFMIII